MKRAFIVLLILAGIGLALYTLMTRSREEQEHQGSAGTAGGRDDDGLPLLETSYEPVAPAKAEREPGSPEQESATAQPGTPTREATPPASEAPSAAPDASLQELDALIASGDVAKQMEARAALTQRILAVPDDGPARAALRQRLEALNAKLFFSPLPTPDSVQHVVAPGEVLWTIKNKYRSSVELIKKVNHLSTDTIRAGQTLKIPQGEFSVKVDRQRFRLIVFLNGHYIKEYRIGIGKDDLTPAGVFEIGTMAKNPSWTDPNGKVHPYGDPENPLGTRWIGFKPAYGRSGLGIHGTTEEESIGTKCSSGCIRLLNADVEEIYAMLHPGDRVVVE